MVTLDIRCYRYSCETLVICSFGRLLHPADIRTCHRLLQVEIVCTGYHISLRFIWKTIVGASLSEPHTSESLVRSSRIQTSTRKSERIPYLVGTVVSRIYTNNSDEKRTDSYLVSTIVHVAKDNKHSLLWQAIRFKTRLNIGNKKVVNTIDIID